MNARAHNGRRVLLALIALSLAPVLAAWGLYCLAPSMTAHSVGQLLPTRPFAPAALPGWPLGSWSLVNVEAGACDAACRQRDFTLGQIRLAQGEQTAHIVRVRLQGSGGAATAPGEVVLTSALMAQRLAAPGYFLIDPLGNQVMFYLDRDNPERVIQEVATLMQTNNAL